MSDLAKISILAFVLVLVFVSFLVFSKGEGESELSHVDRQVEVEEPTESGSIPRRSEGPGPLDIAFNEVKEGEKPEARESEPHAEGAETRGLRIFLLIQDLNGAPIQKSEGSIDLFWELSSGTKSEKSITFRDNSAQFEIPQDLDRFKVKSAFMGTEKRELRITSSQDFEMPAMESGVLSLVAEVVPRVGLHVLDKRTKESLKGVRVYRTTWGSQSDERPLIFENSRLVLSGDSPLLIDVVDHGTQSPYWIVADGYAAECLFFAVKSEGERTIQLEKGGRLEIELQGDFVGIDEVLRPNLRLRLFPEPVDPNSRGKMVLDQVCKEPLALALDNLLPGLYRISVETGRTWRPGPVLGVQEFRIEAGLTQKVQLVVDTSALRLNLVEVKIRVIGIAGQDLPGKVYTIQESNWTRNHPTSTTYTQIKPVAEKPNDYLLDPVKLAPGSYSLTIENQVFSFEVLETPSQEFAFELKAEDDLALKLRYLGSNDYLAGASVYWSGGGASGDARWVEKKQCYLLSPKAGPVHLTVHLDTHMSECDFDYVEGQSALELEIPRGQSYILILKCGDLVIPQDDSLRCTIKDEKGVEVWSRSSTFDGDRIERSLPAAGNFEIEVPHPPIGYRSKAPVKFELKPGDRKEVIYELVEVK